MGVDVTKQAITVNRLINHQNQSIVIEEDIIVPDVKPDILNVIHTNGNVCIYKKEVQDGRIKLDGSIYLNVIYLASTEQNTVRGLTSSIEFSQMINDNFCKEGMELRENIVLQNIECKVLNERKMHVKATLLMELWVYAKEEIKILKDIQTIEGLQIIHSQMKMDCFTNTGNCRASAKDTVHLDEKDGLVEILKTEVQLCNQEIKISYNKVLLKADARVKILYLTEKGTIQRVSKDIPVMGFIDMNGITENNLLNCFYEMRNLIVKPDMTQPHSIMVDIEYEIYCDASESTEIELVQDMYSPLADVRFKKREVAVMANKQRKQEVCHISERIAIPEIIKDSIQDVEVMPLLEKTNKMDGKIIYEGSLHVTFIFSSNEDTTLTTQAYLLPFTFTVESEEVSDEIEIYTRILPIEEELHVMTEGVLECNIDLIFTIEMYKNENIQVIDEITVEEKENTNDPSIVIYIVKEGDSLWKIAKQYRTTVEEIVNKNHIENPEGLLAGQKLFIPRFSIYPTISNQ